MRKGDAAQQCGRLLRLFNRLDRLSQGSDKQLRYTQQIARWRSPTGNYTIQTLESTSFPTAPHPRSPSATHISLPQATSHKARDWVEEASTGVQAERTRLSSASFTGSAPVRPATLKWLQAKVPLRDARNLANFGRASFGSRAHYGSSANAGEPPDSMPGSTPEEAGPVIAVDRSGLFNAPEHSHEVLPHKSEETPLTKHLKALIRFRSGPITVAEYMEEVLTNPKAGFYMNRDVFGKGGDFVTSPDVSQMFGEMVGIWSLALWQQMGSPSKVRLIELGPGRGTLMADLLRGTAKFSEFASAVEVHMVEVSPALRDLQWKTLKCRTRNPDPTFSSSVPFPASSSSSSASPGSSAATNNSQSQAGDSSSGQGTPSALSSQGGAVEGSGSTEGAKETDGRGEARPVEGTSEISGASVRWHLDLENVPRGEPTILIAHEFFDALPVHQFQKTERGWREKLIDVADDASPHHLRFVLSPGPTAASALYLERRLQWATPGERAEASQVEVCPWGLRLAAEIAARVGGDGGGALLVDYGHAGLVQDSLQAIRKHQFVNVLDAPGSADLSAYVDFGALSQAVQQANVGATAVGPVNQNRLLWSLGINFRLEALLAHATPQQARDLQMGYWRLMGEGEASWEEEEEEEEEGEEEAGGGRDGGEGEKAQAPPGMGARYKALAIVKEGLGTPVGFEAGRGAG